jgi:hypothetical protein
MATTTNYAWETPDDTDLVKDGAAAIRTLGSSIDTTTKALNPSTTLGDIEYRSSTANTNTRLGIGTTGQVLIVAGGVPTWGTAPAGDTGPSFGVGLTSEQTITASTWTKVAFNQEDWDTNTNYDSTNYRFTPTVAGYYQINFVIQTNGSTQGRIYKNGSEYMRIGATPNNNEAINGTTLVYCNGSSDYIEAYVNSSSTTVYSTDSVCYFSGSMTRSA